MNQLQYLNRCRNTIRSSTGSGLSFRHRLAVFICKVRFEVLNDQVRLDHEARVFKVHVLLLEVVLGKLESVFEAVSDLAVVSEHRPNLGCVL